MVKSPFLDFFSLSTKWWIFPWPTVGHNQMVTAWLPGRYRRGGSDGGATLRQRPGTSPGTTSATHELRL